MRAYQELRLTREELYDRVWKRPIRDVAPELGLSDVGLHKLCKRNGIPTPPQGYHLMSDPAAKNRLLRPLPDPGENEQRVFHFRIPNKTLQEAQAAARIAAQGAINQTVRPLLPKEEKDIDRLIAEIKGKLNLRQLDDRQMVRTPDIHFPIRVSAATFARATSILRKCLQLALSHGATLSTPKDSGYRQCAFDFQGFPYSLQIEESSRRVEVPPEKRPKRYGNYTWPSDAWKLETTGLLTLKISGPGYPGKTLRDGRRKIEDRLDELPLWLFETATMAKEEERIKNERTAKAVAFLLEQDKTRQAAEFEKRRQRQLHIEARHWRQAQAVRSYLMAVRQAGFEASSTVFDSINAWREWLDWAEAHVASQDPIKLMRAGATPAYPEPREITEIPYVFLDYDDPAEAMRVQQTREW